MNATFLVSALARLPCPLLAELMGAQALDPSSVLDACAPPALNRLNLSKGAQHSNALVSHTSLMLIAACFDRFARVVRALSTASLFSAPGSTGAGTGVPPTARGCDVNNDAARSHFTRLEEAFAARMPDVRTIIALRSKFASAPAVSDGTATNTRPAPPPQASVLSHVLCVNILELYSTLLPVTTFEARFVPARLIQAPPGVSIAMAPFPLQLALAHLLRSSHSAGHRLFSPPQVSSADHAVVGAASDAAAGAAPAALAVFMSTVEALLNVLVQV